ncbi:MAG: tyrosine-type recombinase/integrase [Bacteroidales bacterium]|nr:tyrosine-type recombinase/integrase [Bacteroidales bacterium]
MEIIRKYIDHVRNIRRYSERTVHLYEDVLNRYVRMTFPDGTPDESGFMESFNRFEIRGFMVALMEDEGLSPKSVSLHMSALSSFCRYLVKEGKLKSNPVRTLTRPKVEKRLPEYFREEAMQAYFDKTREEASPEYLAIFKENIDNDHGKRLYEKRLARLIISILYDTGLRRSELIGLKIENVDFARQTLKVVGKGNKMREIPLLDSLCQEILLYLEAVEALVCGKRSLKEPLLVTFRGSPLYPVYVDRTVKAELGDVKGITGRKSPHVLRHSIATELMNNETNLNSIKEMLGHSSLATTQVYTHSSFARLKDIYKRAHPRAKNGGKHGD